MSLTPIECCAICAACFCPPDATTIASYLPDHGPLDVITEEDVVWLGRFKIIGGSASETAFMTGPCRQRHDRTDVTRGNAADVSFGQVIRQRGDGEGEVLSLAMLAPENFWFHHAAGDSARPWLKVHTQCYDEIFLRTLAYIEHKDKIKKDRYLEELHATLCDHFRQLRSHGKVWRCVPEYGPSYPGVQVRRTVQDSEVRRKWTKVPKVCYMEPSNRLGALLTPSLNRIIFVILPRRIGYQGMSIPSFVESVIQFLRALETWQRSANPEVLEKNPMYQAYSFDRAALCSNRFDGLPIDLVLDITDYLTRREVYLLTIASPTTSLKLDLFFWRRRIKRDMPWLWDLDVDALPDRLNWRHVYHDLWDRCISDSQSRVLGLVNRKKIWHKCLALAETYRNDCIARAGEEELARRMEEAEQDSDNWLV